MENDTEEVFYPNIMGYMGRVVCLILVVILSKFWFFSVPEDPKLQTFFGLIWTMIVILGSFIWMIVILGSLGFLFSIIFNFKKLTAKLVISASGIKYSDCLGRIDCTWEDVESITMVTVDYLIAVSGEFMDSWIDCHIFTAKGSFSLTTNESVWKKTTLNNIFKKVVFIKPTIRLTESSTTEYYRSSLPENNF